MTTVAILLIAIAMFSIYFWSKHRERGREGERRRLRECVQGLPGWQPTLVLMHVEDNYNYLEIAAKLEMPARYVLTELSSAYATLRLHELEYEPPHQQRWGRIRAVILYKLLGG